MPMNRWKLIAGSAAVAGLALGGTAVADSGGGIDLREKQSAVQLANPAAGAVGDAAPVPVASDDGSPESADSPNESLQDSAGSPFDSPDDPQFAGPSPESAGSPNESAQDSPAPAPAAASDSPASAASDSPASANSADSASSADSP